MISSHVKISMISLISSCLLNCTLIHWCIIETSLGLPRKSSAIFGNLQTSSEFFGNSQKMFGNIHLAFRTILENLRKFSESGQKSSENPRKCCHQYVYIIKEHYMLVRRYEFYVSRGKNNISLMRYCSCHEKHKIHIFSPPCNILYLLSSLCYRIS